MVDIWVDAFTDDPFLRWIVPEHDRWLTFGPAWLTFVAELCFERGHTYLDDDERAAVAWIPPGMTFLGPDDPARGKAILDQHAGVAKADDAVATMMATRPHELTEPHWTLQYIGVRRGAQATGLGALATADVLERADRDGLQAGLVSTNRRNVSFYERLGFGVVAEVPTPDGATALRPMHRPPATDESGGRGPS